MLEARDPILLRGTPPTMARSRARSAASAAIASATDASEMVSRNTPCMPSDTASGIPPIPYSATRSSSPSAPALPTDSAEEPKFWGWPRETYRKLREVDPKAAKLCLMQYFVRQLLAFGLRRPDRYGSMMIFYLSRNPASAATRFPYSRSVRI